MILWNYLLGEVLTDIHALADYFSLILSCAYLVSTLICRIHGWVVGIM
jgi:hypothetical protein